MDSQVIVAKCEWKIQDAQQTRKELWLCWNGRLRMRSGLPCTFFLPRFSTAMGIICNLVKYRNKRSNCKINNFVRAPYFCSWPTLFHREPKAFMTNSSQSLPRQNERKVRDLCIFVLVFGKQKTLRPTKQRSIVASSRLISFRHTLHKMQYFISPIF